MEYKYKDGYLKMSFGGGTGYAVKCYPFHYNNILKKFMSKFYINGEKAVIEYAKTVKDCFIWNYYTDEIYFK